MKKDTGCLGVGWEKKSEGGIPLSKLELSIEKLLEVIGERVTGKLNVVVIKRLSKSKVSNSTHVVYLDKANYDIKKDPQVL